ncbi:polynucleotide phosphatase/kinase [Hokovirus HKV1]|uniref:Polynucleotide phosphatase/kinase n=1 Tax=Hokovirus HKV1 TaxID=1977638 RepID=A0A1V0SG06_9VIRU|nr:polynucleotide phosphatase/kinase [Hokovirus HKV1]
MSIIWDDQTFFSIGNYDNFIIQESEPFIFFDLDNTLIEFKTKKLKILPNVINKINSLTMNNIAIVTNQKGLNKNKDRLDAWKIKVNELCKILSKKMLIFVCFDSKYRKPLPYILDNIKYNKDGSIFCGDAGGAIGDFSDTDFKFAKNLNIKFIHNKEFFNNQNVSCNINYPIVNNSSVEKIFNDLLNKIPTNELNIIVNVGMSGSGKSSIAELFVGHGYKRINSDTQKLTTNACIKLCANYANNNEKIIIDNTNPEKKTRLEYINIAKKYKIPIYCIYYNIDKGICMHNNIYRHLTKNVPIVPKIAYNIFSKKLEIPDINEGFKDIVELNESYANDDPIYKQYLF